ncbi:tetratricopeptide repeat protein [Dyadobacter tibetensis]|uniref:tetratricopeptide repeat protein n=1 Tax=Dyadobacter tibetensis TaxID=1211851 RepID=UPI0005C4EC82|nr:tetratricopeptide repeat protein [Dyadobacter tibetensis]
MKGKIIRGLIYSFLISGAAGPALAQGERELAQEYFKTGDCDKATTLYNTYLQSDFDRLSLRNYVECMQRLKKWSEAEQFLKKRTKTNQEHAGWYQLYWGALLEAQGKAQDGLKKYRQAIASLGEGIDQNREMAEEFRRLQHPELSLIALNDARTKAKRSDLFQLEVASIYKELNEPEKMIDELLSYGTRYQNVQIVQNMFQDFLKGEKEQLLLEKILYERIQAYPNEGFYNELLIWYQVQKKDFYKAFVQERALDKRFNHKGERLYNLGMLALQNEDYASSGQIFDYIIKEYQKENIYSVARRMAIFAREQQVRNTFPINQEEVSKLVKQYHKLLDDLGINPRTVAVLRNLASLHAFYQNDFEKAVAALDTAIQAGKQDPLFVDHCKLDLGDIYLLKGEPWEASLLYSQVEKSQKDNVLGYDAKLRNAKLHYYKGDFDLAKEVLNILKKATTREIANDANDLSLLIMDNTGLDSSEVAMRAFANIELLLFQNNTHEALDSLQAMLKQYPKHSLTDELLWMAAKTYVKLDSTDAALKNLFDLYNQFGHDILGDDALFEIARLHEEKLNNRELAMKYYQELLEKYPGSIFIAEARKRFRTLRGDLVN